MFAKLFILFVLLNIHSVLKSKTTDTINIKVSSMGHILLPVSIDGNNNGYMIFDTGASKTCLQIEVAEKLKIKTIGKTNVRYAGKNEEAIQPIFSIGSRLSINNLSFRNLKIYGIDLSHNDYYNCEGIIGIIGMDIIRLGVWNFLVEQDVVIFNTSFNYKSEDLKKYQKIKLHTKRHDGGRPYANIKTGRWKKHKFLFDTGFNSILTIRNSEINKFTNRKKLGNGKALSSSGLRISEPSYFETGYLDNLKIGTIFFKELQYLSFDTRSDILGVHFLNNYPFIFDGKSLTLYIREISAKNLDDVDKYPFRIRLLSGEIVVTTIFLDETKSFNKNINLYDRITEVNEEPIYKISDISCERYDILTKMFSKQSVKKIKFISLEGKEFIWESEH